MKTIKSEVTYCCQYIYILCKSNALLRMVAEEAEPLPVAGRRHVNVPLISSTSSQSHHSLVEERTQ